MAGSIGTAFVDVAFDPQQIAGQLGGLGGKVEGAFGKMGGKWGVAAATGFGAAVAGGVAVGKYLYDVGEQFDDMADSIRVSTGKTGKELDTLVADAKKVGTDVPTSFEDAGKAVGFLSQRLGVTGKPLRTLSDQLLEVSRLTGTDLQTNMDAAAGALKKFGVPAEQASATVDKLWRAAQAGQVPFADLASELTKFGTPLQAFGFDLDQSAAMLTSFHKAGVNVRPAMSGLTKSLATLAKAGKDPVEGFKEMVTSIKGARTEAQATAIGVKLFGTRAGPELAKAIRSGALSVADLQKVIAKGHDTVLKAGKDTRDFSENWQIFKNKVAVAVAPAAEKMFAAVGQGMAYLSEELPPLIDSLKRDLGPTFVEIGKTIRDLAPVFKFLGGAAVDQIKVMIAAFKGAADVIMGVVKVVRGLLTGDWRQAWEGAKQVVQGILAPFTAVFDRVRAVLEAAVGYAKTAATAIGRGILDGITAGVSPLVDLVRRAFDSVRSAITGAVSAVTSAASAVGRAIATALQSALAVVGGIATTAMNAVRTAISAAVSAVTGAARTVGTAIVNGVRTALQVIGSVVTGLMRSAVAAVSAAAGAAAGAARAVGASIVSGIRSGLAAVGGAVKGGLDAIWGVISNVASLAAGAARQIGSDIVHGIWDGVSSWVGWLKGKIEGALGFLSHLNPFSTVREGGEKHIGIPIMQGAIDGVIKGTKPLADAVAQSVKDAVEAGRQQVEAARATFGSAWDRLAGDVLTAFDAVHAKLKTAHEKALADMEARRAASERAAALASAQADLRSALAEQAALTQGEGESDADFAKRTEDLKQKVLAAQKAVADAVYEQQHANAERLAAQERVQLDARIALQRRHLEDRLAAEAKALATGKVTAEKAQKDILALMARYGVNYKSAGAALGTAFTTQLRESLNKSVAAIEALLERIRKAIQGVVVANNALKGSAGTQGVAPAAAGARGAVGPGPTAQATPYGAGTMYGTRSPFASVTRALRTASAVTPQVTPVLVRVYIGDEELRGIVRTEVGYADDATARVLLGGTLR